MDDKKGAKGQNGWNEYSRLVLKELADLNSKYDTILEELQDIKQNYSKLEQLEKDIEEQNEWKELVSEDWPPSQMKSAKDEHYKQKGK